MPKSRDIYAIKGGDYIGEIWVYCGKKEPHYNFLSVPLMVNRSVEFETFERGVDLEIVSLVDRAPRHVYKTSKKQFEHNEKSNN
jgi:hypothetical protein